MIATRMEVWKAGERLDYAILAVPPGVDAKQVATSALDEHPDADVAKVWTCVANLRQPDREPDAEVTR